MTVTFDLLLTIQILDT